MPKRNRKLTESDDAAHLVDRIFACSSLIKLAHSQIELRKRGSSKIERALEDLAEARENLVHVGIELKKVFGLEPLKSEVLDVMILPLIQRERDNDALKQKRTRGG